MVNNIKINNKEIGIDMKDEWYNYSPEEQKRLTNYERKDMIEEISYLLNIIKRQDSEIRALQNQSLISIVKDRFNKWFFGTKG